MRCNKCNSVDFLIEDNKIICEYCNRQKYIKKGTALLELEQLILPLKNGEISMYSGWIDLGELMHKLLLKHLKELDNNE